MSLKRYKYLLLATVFALSSPAMAADPVAPSDESPEPPALTSYDWTGFHVGAGLGYGVARQTSGIEIFDYDDGLFGFGSVGILSLGAEMDLGGDGWIGTVEGGYDYQMGNFVIGIVGDYTWSGIETQASIFGDVCYEYPITGTSGADDDCSNNIVSDTPDITYTLNTGDSWSILGRAGVLLNPGTLLYGLGGYTHTSMDADITLHSGPTGPIELISYSYDRDGLTLGAGLETLIPGTQWSAKLEYRNTTWSEKETIPFGPDAGISFWDDAMVQTVRGVLSYRIGADPAPVAAASAVSAANIDWTGLHVGAGLGYGGVRTTAGIELFDYEPGGLLQIGPFDLYSIGAELDRGGDGWIGSVEGGYDYQMGNFVVGIAGDYTWSGIETQGSIFGDVCYLSDCAGPIVSDTPDITYTLKTGESWSVIGRAGILASQQTLLYGLAGYTHTSMDADFTLHSLPTGPVELISYSYDREGLTLGAGIETMIDQNWSLKLEYRNTSWSKETQTLEFGPDAGISLWDDAMVQTARAVLSYRW